jgi:hypothetical protein
MKANKTMRGQTVSNHRGKDKQLEISIDSGAHNQILKQQKQLNGKNQHISININTECQRIQLPHQRKDLTICCLQKTNLTDRNKHWLRVKAWKKIYQASDP